MCLSLYLSLFPNGKARNKPMLSNIEASNTKTIELRKVKASLYDIGIEKGKKQKNKKTKKNRRLFNTVVPE